LGITIRSHGQKEALEAIADAFENIRLAWAWLAVEGEVTLLTRQMLPAIVLFGAARSRGEDVLAMVGAAQGAIQASDLDSPDAAILETAGLAFTAGLYAPHMLESLYLGFELPAEPAEKIWFAFKRIDPRQVDGLWPALAAIFYAWNTKRDVASMNQLRELVAVYGEAGNEWDQAFAMKYLGLIQGSYFAFKTDESMATALATKLPLLDKQEAARLSGNAAAIFEKIGDRLEQADSLRILGGIYKHFKPELALRPLMQAKAIFADMGDLVMLADISATMALRSIWLGDFEEGFAFYKEGRLALEAMGYRQHLAHACAHEAIHALRYSGIDHARQLRLQSRKLYTDLGLTSDLAWTFWELGDIERVATNLDLALDYYQQAHYLIEQEDMSFARIFYARGMGDYSLDMGDHLAAIDYFQDSLRRSLELSHHWAKGYALCGLGRAYLGAGRLAEAENIFLEAVQYTQEIAQNDLSMIPLTGLANLRNVCGDPEQALLMAVFVDQYALTWLETRGQAKVVMAAAMAQLSEKTAEAVRQQALTMTKDEILEILFAQENSEEE
jgi:tetratricopeptide (TPR) repeat protein